MRHGLAVLVGAAVIVPAVAALGALSDHRSGALPDRFRPWRDAAVSAHHAAPPRVPRVSGTPREPRRSYKLASPHTRSYAAARPTPRSEHRTAPRYTDLRLTLSAPVSVRRGGSYEYRIRLANRGPGTPSVVTVRTTLPKGVVRTHAVLPKGVGGYAGRRDATLVIPRPAHGTARTVRLTVRLRPGTRGTLTAGSRVAYVAGARVRHVHTIKVSTRVR